ncbi:alkaline shock response membrane anchor protein AmaP [Mycolicibacterium sp. P1-18]|uniref:alkaline shock response membrane anchor protein AmaP n=1 Tax=Mycolicibacterium sp. P1-18 TaxID=2024615 RepID=UPI0011F24AEA|nr:alkaline shock response membrane anchor protein AmaP [Mycolicibacterium sp. P1-18]KAA0092774.1 alkaline shock response membrane anchor protein AmaP [Mycolicibacterium sp. P1-18]
MTRTAVTFDRFAAVVAGLALIALGAALVVWNTNWVPNLPDAVTAPWLRSATTTGWWPFALAGAGIVLVVLALRWLFAHSPAAKVKSLPLRNDDAGSITVDLGEVADAAAQALKQSLDVESASGKAVIDRGTRTVDLTVTTSAAPRPDRLIPAIDAVCAQISGVLSDPSVATRTTIHTGKRERRRVR